MAPHRAGWCVETGASGVTGPTRGALARPDGYSITLATAEAIWHLAMAG